MKVRLRLLLGSAIGSGALLGSGANAAPSSATAPSEISFKIAPQPLRLALRDFSLQSGIAVFADEDKVAGKASPGFTAIAEPETALRALLAGSGLVYQRRGRTIVIRSAATSAAVAPPQSSEDAVPGDIVVTARKKEESIQDVPVAITAVTQADLTTRQVTGGPDLITQVPNMSFTKTNFSGYSIQIRGIGTQAISATTDPAVSVAFNNTPFIRNRFFEQEFYDLERIEILRGPQGTLYGRNATAGVVNLISAKPAWNPATKVSVDVGSYQQVRLEGMVNVPLVDDKLALRVAGAWTKRDGYARNSLTDKRIDGRDLWSTRASLRFRPTDRLDANLIWEHFQEYDDRLRSGKQLCKTDVLTEVAGLPIATFNYGDPGVVFSQGCKPASLYSDESFQTPNGASLPYYIPLSYVFLPAALNDPYVSRSQSRDLRTIESVYEPKYKAKANIYELQLSYRLTDNLRLVSETSYNTDFTFSTQDFNRFNTAPGAFLYLARNPDLFTGYRPGLQTPGGPTTNPRNGQPERTATFCDPQIGCTDRLVGIDLATARSHQFSQELRVTSTSGGPFNFNLGANFLRYRTEDKYYVFFNSLSLISGISPYAAGPDVGVPLTPYVAGQTTNQECLRDGLAAPNVNGVEPILGCTYIDPNPIDKLNDLGHNYFLSKNPYRLSSYSVFGEGYYDLTDLLKLTVGGRLTLDRKVAPQIPSWVIASGTAGYPVREIIRQRWLKPTGKVSLDWKPALGFTDSTLLYGSISRGYKAGGTNPPRAGIVLYDTNNTALGASALRASATKPKTFKAEYVNAFEIGAKNELFDRKFTVNLAAFYYDYKNYQISQIVDRAAVNLNFDARIWGAEAETAWQAADFLSLGLKLGYQNTRLGKGSQAIDTMDRTAGHTDWQVVRPFPTLTANCILPADIFRGVDQGTGQDILLPAGGNVFGGNYGACEAAYIFGNDPITLQPYVPNPTVNDTSGVFLPSKPGYAGFDPSTAPNNGEGFYKNLEGKELPNAPHFTVTTNADVSLPLGGDWTGTLHGDYYYQAKQWARVFNTPGYDRIKGYANVNLALILLNKAQGWNILAYIKNVFDKTAITGAFLNSDDTALTTNIFLTEPRRYGIRMIKDFDGLPFGLGDPGAPHGFGDPYDITIEGGVQIQRRSASIGAYTPSFGAAFAGIDDFTAIQRHRHFRWQNGTDAAVTVRLDDGWQIAGRFRYGRVGDKLQRRRSEVSDQICALSEASGGCSDGFNTYSIVQRFADTLYTPREQHTIVDFSVGHDVPLGEQLPATISIGVRGAKLRSDDTLSLNGIPDKNIPDGFFDVGFAPFHLDTTDVAASYRFNGIGPVGQVKGSYRLFGSAETGVVAVDWEAGGGVLFGKRRSDISATETVRTFEEGDLGRYVIYYLLPPPVATDTSSIARSARQHATVPTLGGGLGLSYALGRITLKGGYAYDRYFNAVRSTAGGAYDRTIHGPYLKIAMGFGR